MVGNIADYLKVRLHNNSSSKYRTCSIIMHLMDTPLWQEIQVKPPDILYRGAWTAGHETTNARPAAIIMKKKVRSLYPWHFPHNKFTRVSFDFSFTCGVGLHEQAINVMYPWQLLTTKKPLNSHTQTPPCMDRPIINISWAENLTVLRIHCWSRCRSSGDVT